MILVLLGTQNNSFHRLLEEVEKNIKDGTIKEKVIVQAGYTKYNSDLMEIFDLVPRQKFEEIQNQADLIITHGGAGSIISSLQKGKKVIAIPRLHEYDEHVNNHQKEIVEVFNQRGHIIGLKGVEELKDAIIKSKTFVPKKYVLDNKRLISIVDDYIQEVFKEK